MFKYIPLFTFREIWWVNNVDDYATLFASSAGPKNGSMLFYRPHEIEGPTRQDWRFEMPPGETITCTSLPRST